MAANCPLKENEKMNSRRIILIFLWLVLILIAGCTKLTRDESRTLAEQNSKESISAPNANETKVSSENAPEPAATINSALKYPADSVRAEPVEAPQQGTLRQAQGERQFMGRVNRFRFVAFGDYQGGTDVVLKNLRSETGCPEPDFYLNTGDIATLSLFGNKFPHGKLYPARGNNDSDNFWKSIFPFCEKRNYYSFDYLNTHFVMLYSGASITSDQFPAQSASPNCANPISQTDWLYCDLEKVRNECSVDNIIVVLHMPPLTFCRLDNKNPPRCINGYKSDIVELEKLTPIFKTHPKLRAVLSGHNHFYQRLLKDGINYLVIGGAGAGLYDPDLNPPTEVKKQAKQYHFTIFDVDGSKVTLSVMGYDENRKVFAPIESVDLSCKDGDTQEQACSVDGRKGVRTNSCVKGKWVQGACRITPIKECINGDEQCVQCVNPLKPAFFIKTCVNGVWKKGPCRPGVCY